MRLIPCLTLSKNIIKDITPKLCSIRCFLLTKGVLPTSSTECSNKNTFVRNKLLTYLTDSNSTYHKDTISFTHPGFSPPLTTKC